MTRMRIHLFSYFLMIGCVLPLIAQGPASPEGVVPGMVKFARTLNNANGKSVTGTEGVTFLLWRHENGKKGQRWERFNEAVALPGNVVTGSASRLFF